VINPGSTMGVPGVQTSYTFAVLATGSLAVRIYEVRTGREIRRDPGVGEDTTTSHRELPPADAIVDAYFHDRALQVAVARALGIAVTATLVRVRRNVPISPRPFVSFIAPGARPARRTKVLASPTHRVIPLDRLDRSNVAETSGAHAHLPGS
jgi:hypothetical protein